MTTADYRQWRRLPVVATARSSGMLSFSYEATVCSAPYFTEHDSLPPPVEQTNQNSMSKLKMLVPSIGTFFTQLPLYDAFLIQDERRHISSRRFVPPSFNDIRLILNTAQVLSIVNKQPQSTPSSAIPASDAPDLQPAIQGLQLMTFDGDVTLYDDGTNLHPTNPVCQRLLSLLSLNIKIGIVTAAGYTEAHKYAERLYGLLDSISTSSLPMSQKHNLVVMGGESNFLFQYDESAKCKLSPVRPEEWMLDEMDSWTPADIKEILDVAEAELNDCVKTLGLDAVLIRKDRAVGIAPSQGGKLSRESLEETVLSTQKRLEQTPAAKKIPFCAFNGGNDVFVDIGDKSLGVAVCQKFFARLDERMHGSKDNRSDGLGESGPTTRTTIEPGRTLHVGDQFLSAGANDFKARTACATAWIANPAETVDLLDEILGLMKS